MQDIGKARESTLTNFKYFGEIDGNPVCIYVENIRGVESLLFKIPESKEELQLVFDSVSGKVASRFTTGKEVKRKQISEATAIDVKKERESLQQERLF